VVLEFQVFVRHYSALSELTYLAKHHYAWSYLSLEKHDAKLVLSVGCFVMLVMHGVIC